MAPPIIQWLSSVRLISRPSPPPVSPQVIQEIVSQEQTIADLKQAIDDLERPLMVAQTRTQRRGYRPNVEESRDHPQCRSVGHTQCFGQQLHTRKIAAGCEYYYYYFCICLLIYLFICLFRLKKWQPIVSPIVKFIWPINELTVKIDQLS